MTNRAYAIAGKKIAERYKLAGVMSTSTSTNGMSPNRAKQNFELSKAHYTVKVRESESHPETGGYMVVSVHYHPTTTHLPPVRANPRLELDVYKTPEGDLLVHNMQNWGMKKIADKEPYYPFLNSKIGGDIALESLVSLFPNKKIYVINSGEARARFGGRSRLHMGMTSLPEYVLKNYPKDAEKILMHMEFEHPGCLTDARYLDGETAQIFNRIQKGVAEMRATDKDVPGTKLMKKAIAAHAAWARTEHPSEVALGKRMSKAYYSDIPKRHGFVPEKKRMDFGRYGKLSVLKYDPTEAKSGEGIEKIWSPTRYIEEA